MAVVENILTEIGDSIVIKANVTINGLSSITGFIDDVLNETASRFFKKEFRYTLDTINWTSWQALTVPNLVSISIDPTYDFQIEYRYTREGSDPSGVLSFNNVDLQGTYIYNQCGITFQKSVFAQFFPGCSYAPVLEWCISVLEKIYKPGIVSKTLIRDGNQNKNNEDRDYIDFWRAVCCYFASLVIYAREFESFRTNRYLLIEYLRQRGLFVCEGTSVTDMNYLMENYYDEIRHRGTPLISLPKGEDINGVSKPVDGELLRLICYNPSCDEFLFSFSEFNSIGLVVGEWSPLYSGIKHQSQLVKIYESSKDIIDLSNYPLINPAYCSLQADGGKNVLSINSVPAGEVAGIGFTNPTSLTASDIDFLTNISTNIAYTLSFYIRAVDLVEKFTVRMHGYNVNNTKKSFRDIKVSALMPISDDVIVEQGLPTDDKYYQVEAILHPSNHIFVSEESVTTPSIGVGNNLRSVDLVCKFAPEIILDNTNGGSASGEIRLWNIGLTPTKTDYSTGFIGTANFTQTWIKKNNDSLTEAQLSENMIKYLLPYKATLKNNYI